MEDNLNTTTFSLDAMAKNILKETAKWANFLAIMGFVGIGFMVLIAIFAGTIFSSIPGVNGVDAAIDSVGFTVMYLLIAALYFFPVMYLFKFAKHLKLALSGNNKEDLLEAFTNLKSHYKFIGILTIVMLSFYAFVIVIAVISGIAASVF